MVCESTYGDRTHGDVRPMEALANAVSDTVARGDVLAVVEGMKMQHAIRAGRDGRVENVLASAGELVDADTVLFDIAAR